jgi:hypothetical protein
MEEVKRYEDMLLTPYVDGVEDQPLRPGHEQYLTYMPKGMSLTKDMVDTRRVSLSQRGGVSIKQAFNSNSCDVAMNIETIQPSDGTDLVEDIRYLISAAPQGNRQFSINVEHSEKINIDTTLGAELQELPAELQLRELDDALDKIQELDQRHVVRLAQGKNLVLSDIRQLTLLSEAVKGHSYDENLREVQILSNTASAGRVYQKVAVVRRGQDDTYLTVQLANEKMLRIYAEGIPSRGALDHSHYDIKEKLDMLNERMQQLTNNITPQSMMTAMRVDRQRKRLEVLETVRQDARKLTYSDIIDLDDPSLEEYPFEDILNSAVQNAIYNVSSEYRVDMELERQEEQSIDISDLSDHDVQNLEF